MIDQDKVGVGQGFVCAFDGEDEITGDDIFGKGFFEKLIGADAGEALGNKADVIVLGLGIPLGGDDSQAQPRQ